MKICTYRRNSPIGAIKRLGIILEEKTILDVNFIWQAEYERQDFYQPENRAKLFAPSSLNQFIKMYQDASISKLQYTIELYNQLAQSGILKTISGADIAFNFNDFHDLKFDAPLDDIPMYRDFYTHS